MRVLHHQLICPFSRKVRIVLAEKRLPFETIAHQSWALERDFLILNPAGTLPVLIEPDGRPLADSTAICEYLEEIETANPLFYGNVFIRAEIRRLVAWFDVKFHAEVGAPLVWEKLIKRQMGGSFEPDSRLLRQAYLDVDYHLSYIGWLSEQRRWLAGDFFSLADITAAAHLSCIDYLGALPWEKYDAAKDWYARIKSRPSLRPLLADLISNQPPPRHYADLDF